MSEYEFWDELGNIFNAIVAYQHKTIEFNKRFVNPWIRLGTVFDQNDRNSDALLAARKAIEIDRESGSNWFALGDVYFKMGSFDDAAGAYGRAIELNPKLGWAYANLALTKATQQKYTEAVNLYVKSLELVEGDKDRSMIWNRLGNVYRKVNDYENAFIAFQMADECDGQNTGFHDQLDEVTLEQKVMPIVAEVYVNNNGRHPVASQPVNVEESATADETMFEQKAVDEVSVDDTASEAATMSVEESPAAMEVESVSENQTVEEFGIGEAVGTAELNVVADQDTDLATPVIEDAPITSAQETESGESEALWDADELEQQTEEPVIAELAQSPEADGAQAVSEEETLEELRPALEEEVPSENVIAEDTQRNITIEMPVEENAVDESQPKPNEGIFSEDVIAEDVQPETVSVVSLMENETEKPQSENADEIQPESVAEENPVSVHADPDTAVAMPVVSFGAETFVDPSALNQPVVLVVENLAELIAKPAPGDDAVAEVLSSDESDSQLEARAEADARTESVLGGDEVAEVVAEIVALAVENEEAVVVENVQSETAEEEGPTPVFADPDTSIATPVTLLGTETFADPSALNQPVVLVVENLAELIAKPAPGDDAVAEVPSSDESDSQLEARAEADARTESVSGGDEVAEVVAEIVALAVENEEAAVVENAQFDETAMDEDEVSVPVVEVENVQADAAVESASDDGVEPAYEEFLKNAVEPVFAEDGQPVKNDLKAEPDSKNAHVWNELGNVYFNTGAYEEAVSAYSKAIELDAWFAWPYSNLALVYVQKEKYAEAILLYQRSIELFSSDKDKAITWNRLGNVYRRLVDYDNAIACYQRADELDPNNATRSLRSRFSLLGSLNLEHSSSVAG